MIEEENPQINKLKKLIEKHGVVNITKVLGYRSISTVKHWIRMNEVPPLAQQKFKELLNKNRVRIVNESK